MGTNNVVSTVTGQLTKIGNFLVRDLGDHKVYGVKTALISRVWAVESPSEMRRSENIPQVVSRTQPCERPSDGIRARCCNLDRSL